MNHDGANEHVAGQGACSVYRCGCGCVHVHVGSTTLRMNVGTLRDLARILQQARLRLEDAHEIPTTGSTVPC